MKGDNRFGVIDGHQRLATVVMFLSALFIRLKFFRYLTEEEMVLYEDLIKRHLSYRFTTSSNDKELLNDYAIGQVNVNRSSVDSESGIRIMNAFDFFTDSCEDKSEQVITKMIKTVSSAICTTYTAEDEFVAKQLFVFKSDRGKVSTWKQI